MLEVTFKIFKEKLRKKNYNTSGYCSFVIGANFLKLQQKGAAARSGRLENSFFLTEFAPK